MTPYDAPRMPCGKPETGIQFMQTSIFPGQILRELDSWTPCYTKFICKPRVCTRVVATLWLNSGIMLKEWLVGGGSEHTHLLHQYRHQHPLFAHLGQPWEKQEKSHLCTHKHTITSAARTHTYIHTYIHTYTMYHVGCVNYAHIRKMMSTANTHITHVHTHTHVPPDTGVTARDSESNMFLWLMAFGSRIIPHRSRKLQAG